MPRPVLAAVLVLLLGTAARADPFEDGITAYARNDFAAALHLWKPVAEAGHADAQNNVGLLYENGQGVPADPAEAARWYRRAAEQGHADAQLYLGALYESGRGVPQDLVRAHMWLDLSAAKALGGMLWGGLDALSARQRVAARLTAEQLAQARAMAARCLPSQYWECE
jgi:TPR repeat protein